MLVYQALIKKTEVAGAIILKFPIIVATKCVAHCTLRTTKTQFFLQAFRKTQFWCGKNEKQFSCLNVILIGNRIEGLKQKLFSFSEVVKLVIIIKC